MRIAIPSSHTDPSASVEARFARAPFFLVCDLEHDRWETIENAQVLNAPQGAGIQTAELLARHHIQAVLTTHCGPKAFRVLQAAGITVYTGVTGTVEQALHLLRDGRCKPASGPDVEGHW